MEGIVRWFEARLGYGFIIAPENPELLNAEGKPVDIFAHYSKIQMDGFKKLEAGEKVTFELVISPDGKPQAINIVRLPEE